MMNFTHTVMHAETSQTAGQMAVIRSDCTIANV